MRSIAVLQGPFPPPPPPSEASATVVGGGVQTSSPLTAPEYLASASPGEDITGSSVAFVTPGLVLFFAAAASLAAAAAFAAKSRRRARRMVRGFLALATALRRTADSSIMLSPRMYVAAAPGGAPEQALPRDDACVCVRVSLFLRK